MTDDSRSKLSGAVNRLNTSCTAQYSSDHVGPGKGAESEAKALIERSDKYFGNGSDPHEYPSEILRDMTAFLRATQPTGGEEPGRCICQDQHRRGYCTEPGCKFAAALATPTAMAQSSAQCTAASEYANWTLHRQPNDHVADHKFSIWSGEHPVVLANEVPGEEGALAYIVSQLNGVAQTPAKSLAPISGAESCTCHFFGGGTHHVPGCPFYTIATSLPSTERGSV